MLSTWVFAMAVQVVDIAGEKSHGLSPARYCLDQVLIGTFESCDEVWSCRGGGSTGAGSASEFMSWFFGVLCSWVSLRHHQWWRRAGPSKNHQKADGRGSVRERARSGGSYHGNSFVRDRSVEQKVQVLILQQCTVKTWRAGHAEGGRWKITHWFIKPAREELVEALTEVPNIPDCPGTTEWMHCALQRTWQHSRHAGTLGRWKLEQRPHISHAKMTHGGLLCMHESRKECLVGSSYTAPRGPVWQWCKESGMWTK